jgi:hypothetical protein
MSLDDKNKLNCGKAEDCIYARKNAEKIYKLAEILHEPFENPCIAFKPGNDLTVCLKYQKMREEYK